MFRPTIGLTLLLFFLAMVFSGMGYWQLQRKAEKENLFEQYKNAPLMDLSEAASNGSTAFFDPAVRIVPSSGRPPSMINLSMSSRPSS